MAEADARLGQVLRGKWRLDAVLGTGGMATVYRATHRNGKRAAVKILHPEYALREKIRDRFLREGYAANRIGDEGVVSVLDDDVDGGTAFLVMELLEGETLAARAEAAGGTLPPAEVLTLLDALLAVLAKAHAASVVHRDIKPENLFLTREGRLKVLDFGIARLRELPTGGPSLTADGVLIGTPAFMSPEQALAHHKLVDGRSDLWSVGALAFSLLTGRYVHEGRTTNEQLVLAASVPARSLASLRVDLPPRLVAAVDRALAFRQDDRWPDASSMREALREAAAELRARPRAPSVADEQSKAACAEAPTMEEPRFALAPTPSVSGASPLAISSVASLSATGERAAGGGRWPLSRVTLLLGLLTLLGVAFGAARGRYAPTAAGAADLGALGVPLDSTLAVPRRDARAAPSEAPPPVPPAVVVRAPETLATPAASAAPSLRPRAPRPASRPLASASAPPSPEPTRPARDPYDRRR